MADGRRARRDRNRSAVIDGMFDLLDEGRQPSTEEIAERAGVSVSSVFRYFDGLDDLQRQTIDTHFERFGPLFDVPALGSGDLDARISRLVDARLALHSTVAPVARLARARAIEQPLIAETLAQTRRTLAAQLRTHFALELEGRTGATVTGVVDAIDVLTSFESWDLLTTTHGRAERLIRRMWTSSIRTLLLADP